MSKKGRHHYIPVFYLKQWAEDNGQVCEFSKPYDRVKPRRTHPDGTGYYDGLNTVEGLPPDEAQFLEEVFFKIADDAAARALRILFTPSPWSLTRVERSGWSRFILSLMIRNPQSVRKHKEVALALFRKVLSRIEESYARDHGPNDPPTYAEYARIHGPNPEGRTIVRVLQSLFDNAEIGRQINSMRWLVLSARFPRFPLLTSDRPVLITNGIGLPNAKIILPISPSHIFLATNNAETENKIRAVWRSGDAIPAINDRVASQSRKYVYGTDDKQLSFVSKRLGLSHTADPLENLSAEALIAGAFAGLEGQS